MIGTTRRRKPLRMVRGIHDQSHRDLWLACPNSTVQTKGAPGRAARARSLLMGRRRVVQHWHSQRQCHAARDGAQVRQVPRDRSRHSGRGGQGQEHPRDDRRGTNRRPSRGISSLTRFGDNEPQSAEVAEGVPDACAGSAPCHSRNPSMGKHGLRVLGRITLHRRRVPFRRRLTTRMRQNKRRERECKKVQKI